MAPAPESEGRDGNASGTTTVPLLIGDRFNGPDGSGNGGYSAASIAVILEPPSGSGVEVSLRLPPPLGTEMGVMMTPDGGLVALHDDKVVMEAKKRPIDDFPVPDLSFDAASRSVQNFPFKTGHPFPNCFSCGNARDDGLSIHCGRVEVDGAPDPMFPAIWAGIWCPDDASLCGADGVVDPRVVWAALDCPSAAPFADTDSKTPAVLARIQVKINHEVPARRNYILVAWPQWVDGRKHCSRSALLGDDGRVYALAEALWITLSANK